MPDDTLVARLEAALQARHARAEDAKEHAHHLSVVGAGGVVTLYDPDDELAMCDAHQQIIDEHMPYHVITANDGLNWDYRRCVVCQPADRELESGESYWPCPTIRALAAGYRLTDTEETTP